MIKLGCNTSLPSGWQWAEAGKVIDIRDGTHDSPKPVEVGIPLVTSKNLKNGKIDFSTCTNISAEDHEQISKRSAVDDGDILYAMIGTIGNPVIVQGDRDFSIKNVALFKFSNSQVFNRYFYHLLGSSLVTQQFEKNARGGTQKFVSLGNIRALQIPLPPLEEQQRIAAILDKADAIHQKRKQAIELADEFLRSVFLDMFGDPVTNPKGWEVSTLATYGNFKNGMNYSKDEVGKELYCIGVGDFKSFDRICGTSALSKIQLNELPDSGYLLQENDLLFVRSNGNKELVGRCLSVHPGNEDVTYSGFCIRYRIDNKECLDANYVNYCLRIPSMKHLMLKGGQGANIQNINQKILSELPFTIPPIELQKEFASIVIKYRSSVDRVLENDTFTKELFNALSQQAFSGQL
ncbi:restriction endonuclease subunit S [Vibrio furnissii]|uniref:restriction endonuclease subunit S n=1 Tax=Vibrio furnissii TaxID=29494 RepID=UPI003D7E72BA